MKKKILLLIAVITFCITGCSESKPADSVSKKEETIVARVVEKSNSQNTTETNIGTKEEKSLELKMLDDKTKEFIKQFVETYIPDNYKTSFYTCDILTPTNGSGGIVSIQIENDSFTDESACSEAVIDIVGKMLNDQMYENINSFQFYLLANSQLIYTIDISDAQAIASTDVLMESINITAF